EGEDARSGVLVPLGQGLRFGLHVLCAHASPAGLPVTLQRGAIAVVHRRGEDAGLTRPCRMPAMPGMMMMVLGRLARPAPAAAVPPAAALASGTGGMLRSKIHDVLFGRGRALAARSGLGFRLPATRIRARLSVPGRACGRCVVLDLVV